MRKGIETICKNEVFGDEDLMNHKAKHQTTAVAKSPCWILKVKQDLFKTEMKETVRRIKEAKAVFIFYCLPNKNKAFGYMKYKDFFTKHFIECKCLIHETVIEQGSKANSLMIIKQGSFELIKKIQYKVGYYEKQAVKQSEIVLVLTPGSIIGEEGYLYGTNNSYMVRST